MLSIVETARGSDQASGSLATIGDYVKVIDMDEFNLECCADRQIISHGPSAHRPDHRDLDGMFKAVVG
jgi:hypothetical protein